MKYTIIFVSILSAYSMRIDCMEPVRDPERTSQLNARLLLENNPDEDRGWMRRVPDLPYCDKRCGIVVSAVLFTAVVCALVLTTVETTTSSSSS